MAKIEFLRHGDTINISGPLTVKKVQTVKKDEKGAPILDKEKNQITVDLFILEGEKFSIVSAVGHKDGRVFPSLSISENNGNGSSSRAPKTFTL